MDKEYYYLEVTRDLNFKGLKKADKESLLKGYKVIIRRPIGLSSGGVEEFEDYYIACKNTMKSKRQVIINGLLLNLSQKEYFTLYVVLSESNRLEEKDYNSIDWRPQKCKKEGQKAERNLVKSIDDLKRGLKTKIQKECEKSKNYFNNYEVGCFDEELFNDEFKKIACCENDYRGYYSLSQYKYESTIPSFLQRVKKQTSKIL